MAEDFGCHICGQCWWVHCENDADYTIRRADIKRNRKTVYIGDIDLCAGHARFAEHYKRLDLNWLAIEQAIALQKERV